MDDVENNVAVMQESDTPETSPQESTPDQDEQIESKQDRNWREMRRKNAELERKTQAQEEVIQGFIKQTMANQQAPAQVIDDLEAIPDGDYIPKGDVKKLLSKGKEEIKREAVEEMRRIMAEQEKANFHIKLKQKFSDFDEVVTPETLELFEQQDPDLAATIVELKDPYKMGLQTYKFIKSMGLASNAPAHRRSKEVEKRLDQNQKTVQSPQAYDKRPMAQTFQMTEQLKQELWREMNDCSQRAGGVPNL